MYQNLPSFGIRAQYLMDISIFSSYPEFFVFIDEMGSGKCVTLPVAHEGKHSQVFCLEAGILNFLSLQLCA